MKHENLFKIYIPEPCHEDWDKMNPNEQGAFCKVCSKTVVDFSVKTETEIQKFLGENLEKKICGRFKKDQLEETPRLKVIPPKFEFPRYLFPLSYSPARVFTMAMLLFASVALASCGNSDTGGIGGEGDSTHIMINGDVNVRTQQDTVKETKEINENNNQPDPNPMGGISIQQVQQEQKAQKEHVRIDSSAYCMVGEVALKNNNDSTQVNNNTDSTKVINQNVKMGMIKPVKNEKDYMKGDLRLEK